MLKQENLRAQLLRQILNQNIDKKFQDLYQRNKKKINDLQQLLMSRDMGYFTILDPCYPKELRHLENPPLVFCYYGNLNLLKCKNKISIVGSRKMDPDLNLWFEKEFIQLKSWTTVSGGARGVDQSVLKNSFKNQVPTITILPSGILDPYPKSLQKWFLKERKKDNLLFLSQFSPIEAVKKMNFYPRNRILASMSSKTLVLQAHVKSGTMITAKYAIEMGKDVYALICFPWDDRFSGNTRLLEDGAYQTIDLNLFHL